MSPKGGLKAESAMISACVAIKRRIFIGRSGVGSLGFALHRVAVLSFLWSDSFSVILVTS